MKKVILLLVLIVAIVSCKKKDVTPTAPVEKPIEYRAGFLVGSGNYTVTDVTIIVDSDTLGSMDPDHLSPKNANDIYNSGVVPTNAVFRPVVIDKEFTITAIYIDFYGTNLLHTFTGKIIKNSDKTLSFVQTSEWQNPSINGCGILQVTTKSMNGTLVFVIYIC